ncbi:MAG: RHS repeat-associated core domain-containing protein, partial [Pseudomonas sp.]
MTSIGYNGQLHEPEGQWQFLGNGYRVYNPVMMRFHSPDELSPFGQGGLNAYTYCGADPINHADPTGHFYIKMMSLVSVFVGLGATLGFAGVAVSTQSTEQRVLAIAASVAGFAAMVTAGRYIYIKRHTKLPTAPTTLPRTVSVSPSAPPLS